MSNLSRFCRNCEGTVSILTAAVAVPATAAALVGVSVGIGSITESEARQIAQETCDRIASSYMTAQPASTQQQSADELLAARLPGILDSATFRADLAGPTIEISGQMPTYFAGDRAFSLLYPCAGAIPAASSAAARLVFSDDFETPVMTRFPQGTYVHQVTANWTTLSGPGLQYWHNATHQLRGITTPDGDQMIELDSTDNPGTGGIPSSSVNAVVSTPIDIAFPGRFELSFLYRARTTGPGTNGVEAYWAADGDPLPGGAVISVDNTTTWTTYRVVIDVDSPGRYHLSFGATGRDDYVGGLVDQVELRQL